MAFTSWMAMLFYLPRLFVYHTENADNKNFVSVIKIQESKLYWFIGLPALIGVLITGVALIAYDVSIFKGGWLHAKIMFVLFLIIFHFLCGFYLKQLSEDRCMKSGKFFRIFNEIPTILMFIIVVFVILKPF